jgi:hypothetical protein
LTKLLSSLAGLAALLLAMPVRALPTWAAYSASLGGAPVGTLYFDLDEQVPGGCRYMGAWEFGDGIPGEQCAIDESTSAGHRSCLRNALRPVPSLVLLAAGEPCWGFDGSGQSNSVFTLILDERVTDGALDGLVQLDSATSAVSSFHASPSPFFLP